jgi:hypothetical protein
MYDECIIKGNMDLFILREKDLMNEEMKVYMIYSHDRKEMITPVDDRMQALIRS